MRSWLSTPPILLRPAKFCPTIGVHLTILSCVHTRTVAQDYTIHLDGKSLAGPGRVYPRRHARCARGGRTPAGWQPLDSRSEPACSAATVSVIGNSSLRL